MRYTRKVKVTKKTNETITFAQFFDTLDTTHKLFVSNLVLAGEENIQEQSFDHLLTELKRKHWKVIVKDIQVKLESAVSKINKTKYKKYSKIFSI